MADPFTVAGGALIGAGATLLGAAVTGTVGVGKLAYDIHKDRKEAKRNGGSEVCYPSPGSSGQDKGNITKAKLILTSLSSGCDRCSCKEVVQSQSRVSTKRIIPEIRY